MQVLTKVLWKNSTISWEIIQALYFEKRGHLDHLLDWKPTHSIASTMHHWAPQTIRSIQNYSFQLSVDNNQNSVHCLQQLFSKHIVSRHHLWLMKFLKNHSYCFFSNFHDEDIGNGVDDSDRTFLVDACETGAWNCFDKQSATTFLNSSPVTKPGQTTLQQILSYMKGCNEGFWCRVRIQRRDIIFCRACYRFHAWFDASTLKIC